MIQIDRQLLTHTFTRPAIRPKSKASGEYSIKEVRAIVAHWTANTDKGADAQANRNYFNNGSPGPKGTLRAASAHYCVDDHSIIQCLPDHEVGFHVGAKNYLPAGISLIRGTSLTPNHFTVGFEMCVNMDGDWAKTYENSARLAAWLLLKHNLGVDQLLRHHDITGKDCPKMMLDAKVWERFKADVWQYRMYYAGKDLFPFRVTSKELNVRSGPGTAQPPLYVLAQGEVVLASGDGVTRREWVEIESGKFVNSKYLG